MESRVIAFIILFWIVEDFLWFVINPAWRISAFRRDRIIWHQHAWWGIMPREYWVFLPVALALYVASLR
jgi:hypothetical protein